MLAPRAAHPVTGRSSSTGHNRPRAHPASPRRHRSAGHPPSAGIDDCRYLLHRRRFPLEGPFPRPAGLSRDVERIRARSEPVQPPGPALGGLPARGKSPLRLRPVPYDGIRRGGAPRRAPRDRRHLATRRGAVRALPRPRCPARTFEPAPGHTSPDPTAVPPATARSRRKGSRSSVTSSRPIPRRTSSRKAK